MEPQPGLFEDVQDEIEPSVIDEPENDSEIEIKHPFNPKEIDIAVESRSLDMLIGRIKHNEIDMNTEFQRKGNLWTPQEQSRLIESILLRFPLPAFYFDASNDDKWLIVDGLQRLWTLKNFVIDQTLQLQNLEILTQFKGRTYERLERTYQRRINEVQVPTYLIKPGTPKEVKYNIFRRINTGGRVLTPQEIRFALNQGKPANFLKRIAESKQFKSHFNIAGNRLEDQELVLRFIAFSLNSYHDYMGPFHTFLDNAMEQINKESDDKLIELEHKFFSVLDLITSIEKDKKLLKRKGSKKLNSALFEVWTTVLAGFFTCKFDFILAQKGWLLQEYNRLLLDQDFDKSVASSTSSVKSVKIRFQSIETLIEKAKNL